MKKFTLLLALGSMCYGAGAQQISTVGNHVAKTPAANHALVRPAKAIGTANKTTVTDPRWYSYFDEVNEWNSQALENNLSVIRMWFDTTIRQVFSTGAGTINYSGASMFYDPIRFQLYNDPARHPGEMKITATNAYTVDSVRFFAVYEEAMNRPSTVVDTLVISVAPTTGRYALRQQDYSWVAPYLPAGKDTLYAYTVYNVDSVNRAAFGDVTAGTRRLWKEPLTASMRDTGFNIKEFTFAVPQGGMPIPAGNDFSITVAFKSGDTWTKNVDTIDNFHRWMLLSASTGDGTVMPYYYYDLNDRNMSNMMFSTDTASFLPSVIIEGINTPDFDFEFHNIDAHILCPTCPLTDQVGVNDIEVIANVGNAFPNPANTEVAIPFSLKSAASVNVTLSNTLGQVVKTLNMGKMTEGKATFNVANLSAGVYFYTVEAAGQRITKRMVVTH